MREMRAVWEYPVTIPKKTIPSIVDKLLDCPTIKDRGSLETALGQLYDQIGNAITKHDVPKIHVTNIVTTCLRYQDGFRQLIDAVAYFEENSLLMQRLEALLQEIYSSQIIISWELFEELVQIVWNLEVPQQELKAAYIDSAPIDWSAPDDALDFMLWSLAKAPQQADDTVPLLKFVAWLAQYMHEQITRDKLEDWIKRAAQESGLGDGAIDALRQKIRIRQHGTAILPYLLIKIRPDDFDSSLFYVEAWFSGKQNEYQRCLYTDEEPRKLETISGLLDQLLEQCDGYITNPTQKLTIEVFLPFSLLNYNVDQWMIDAGFGEMVPVSSYYPLVRRSWDRVYNSRKRVRDAWKQSWSLFEERVAVMRRHLYQRDCERQGLLAELLGIPCLTFTFVMPDSSDVHTRQIFSRIVAAGVPVALWPRWQNEPVDEQEIQNMYESFLPHCDFSALPQLIWKKRISLDEHRLMHHLALLWDDPNRLPPDVQPDVKLVAPLMVGKEANHG